MIKAYSVRYDKVEKITIDTHFRIDKELEEKHKEIHKTEEEQSDEFVEGLSALVIDALPDDQDNSEKASRLLEEAKKEAAEIIENAKKEAEQIKNDTYATAKQKGYEDGALQVKHEAEKLKADYEKKEKALEMEYETLAASLEPHMVQIITDLVEKMTGILVSDHKEVISYLIQKALQNLDKSNSYTIRVSAEDYESVMTNKDNLLQIIGKDVALQIANDPGLSKNQCLIETELKVINCSLDHQMEKLFTDLKLLGGI